jgi:CRISP-associated protein Cas1
VGICLPGETRICSGPSLRASSGLVQRTLFEIDIPQFVESAENEEPGQEIRRLIPARDDLRPLYLNTPGLHVGKSGLVLRVKERNKVLQDVRLNEINQLNLFGNIQLTTQAIQTLCEGEVPIAYFSMGGWFYGLTQGLGLKNIFTRREQFRLADSATFCLQLSRSIVAGKIRNQRTLLQRNHVDPPRGALAQMKALQEDALRAESREQLLGIEGNAARHYFAHFAGMIKVGTSGDGASDPFCSKAERERGGAGEESSEAAGGARTIRMDGFRFEHRNRRPPRDAVNALLSLGYSLLAKDLTIVAAAVGLDPYLGFFHQPRFGRASLALDLMEPFRPLIADSAVLSAINTRMVVPEDFIRGGNAVALLPEGRKKFFRAYEQRMDTLVTHPNFGYRVNYRRVLEIQTRLLARVLNGEIWRYPVFTTR